MITDVYYTLHTESERVLADWVQTDWATANQITRGESATLNLHFSGDASTLTVNSSYTVESGTAERYDQIIVEGGATLTINGELYGNTVTIDDDGNVIIADDALFIQYGAGFNTFELIQEIGDYAGGYAPIETLDSETRYKEQIPTDATSILVGIEPSDKLKNQNIPGVWAVVDSATDTRPRALSDQTFELSVTVLAEYSEYSNHETAESNLTV